MIQEFPQHKNPVQKELFKSSILFTRFWEGCVRSHKISDGPFQLFPPAPHSFIHSFISPPPAQSCNHIGESGASCRSSVYQHKQSWNEGLPYIAVHVSEPWHITITGGVTIIKCVSREVTGYSGLSGTM